MSMSPFIAVPEWALRLRPRVSPPDLLVLGAINSIADTATLEARVGSRSLAARVNADRANVRAAIKNLCALGVLEVLSSNDRTSMVVRLVPPGVTDPPGARNPRGSGAPKPGGHRPPHKKKKGITTQAAPVRAAIEEAPWFD